MDRSRASLVRALLRWYDAERRDLPWRGIDDPYAVWVSEVMLQQTRVETATPYFLAWMEHFPDLETLAASDRDAVLRSWQGLGYYSRARNLHEAARVVVAQHGGRMPTTRDGLMRLPGIGAYTAGAIASIAFGEAVPAVDGNVLRVLARLTGNDVDITTPNGRKVLTEAATGFVPRDRPGDWNQALMELGATLCTPRSPDCDRCPVRADCVAHRTGRTLTLPARSAKPAPREVRMRLAWVECDDAVLLTRAPENGLLGGLWGLPGGPDDRPLGRMVREQTGVRVRQGRLLGETEHRFTHRLWRIEVRRCRVTGQDDGAADGTAWVPKARLHEQAIATAHRKALACALSG
ncbi:MAG: A/G-specific adenine glycosylase [Euryarchaeota archaeon]|nr:A/G-specific adenine glycosylase [Euryarchaeota archaeon]